MIVISKPNLFEAARKAGYAPRIEKVARWYELATKNDFGNLVGLQHVFPSADWAGETADLLGIIFAENVLRQSAA